jgi:drug/metabolite transporter (DMT)-like permease
MLMWLIPFFGFQLYFLNADGRAALKTPSTWLGILIAGVAVTFWTGTFAFALNYTSLTEVYLLNNCQPILLVIYNRLKKIDVNGLHVLGVVLGIIGLLLAWYMISNLLMIFSLGNYSSQTHFSWQKLVLGDVVAFVGAVFAAIYLTWGGTVRSKIPVFLFLMPVTLINFIVFLILSVIMEKPSISLLFGGWVQKENILPILWLGIFTGILGISSISTVMKNLPGLMISVVLLCEPIAATFMALIIRVEPPPPALTWVGAVLVTVGISFV